MGASSRGLHWRRQFFMMTHHGGDNSSCRAFMIGDEKS